MTPPTSISSDWRDAGGGPTLVALSELPPCQVPALAALHMNTVPSLLTDLGRPVVLRYYQVAQRDPSVIGICALGQSQSPQASLATHSPLLASVVASPNPSALYVQLRRPVHWFAAQMLRVAVTRPRLLVQLAPSARSAFEPLAPEQIELIYIGVAPEVRGQGLGQVLLDAFLEASRQAGRTSVVLSVETDNLPAVALYTKAGFAVTKTFSEGRYHRYRMERTL